KRAFDSDSPLAMPDLMSNRDVSPNFTSPLDRLRRVGDVIGMQRLVEFATLLAGGDPPRAQAIKARLDLDGMHDTWQASLGAPAATLRAREAADNDRQQADQMAQAMNARAALKGAGDAAQSVGAGLGAAAEGTTAAQNAPALRDALGNMPDMM